MTLSVCESCSYLRPRMNIRSLLVDVLRVYLPNRMGDTLEELERWWDEEQRREGQTLKDMSGSENMIRADWTPQWPRRPKTQDYCGVVPHQWRATDLVRDSETSCSVQRPGARPHQSCLDCAYHITVPDAQIALHQSATSQADARLTEQADRFAEGIARSELVEGVKSGGVLRTKPKFLPHCSRLSRPGAYIVGPIINWTLACGYWEQSQS